MYRLATRRSDSAPVRTRSASTSRRPATATGTGALLLDGKLLGEAPIKRFTPVRFSITGVGLWCGRGGNLAVADDYEGPFPLTGALDRVVVDVTGPPHVDAEAEADIIMATE